MVWPSVATVAANVLNRCLPPVGGRSGVGTARLLLVAYGCSCCLLPFGQLVPDGQQCAICSVLNNSTNS